ncbi:geranylgeranyl reductase family protein [Pseudolysinimonas sp.]|uniref:geranylgeranyl reductase family protein n=1 Tax=Pseudolysinimonas sp. TaxID=2680009 RepID=UPI003F81BD82
MTERWDVVVVGAGPAGSAAARAAAAQGARTLLVDRARFPRYKTCGGGITGWSLRELPDAVQATFEDRITRLGIGRDGRDRHWIASAEPFLGMVRRADFDQALVDGAVAAGAFFRDGVAVRGIAEDADGVRLRTDDGELLAGTVVGADGTGGRTAGYVGVHYGGTDLGLEVELAAPEHEWRGRALFDWGPDAGSYAWLFPKRDTLTVGVIQRTGVPDRTRAYLDRWLGQLGLASAERLHDSGHLTRWRTSTSPLRRGRVLVAGDAAGLLEPWTREGISFALRSGRMAGEAAASGDLELYVRRVGSELVPQQRAGATMLRVMERFPAAYHRGLAGTPAGRRLFLDLCRGAERVDRMTTDPVIGALARRGGRRYDAA